MAHGGVYRKSDVDRGIGMLRSSSTERGLQVLENLNARASAYDMCQSSADYGVTTRITYINASSRFRQCMQANS